MTLRAEWRRGIFAETIVTVDGANRVRAAFDATPELLSLMLTNFGDLELWRNDRALEDDQYDPASWGELVIARAQSGEVITMDPEAFWDGIYKWFRSRGVDFDTPIDRVRA